MDAFFVKSDYSVPGDVHSAYNYTHFVSVWQHFANYFDNSYRSYIPYVLLNYVRHLYFGIFFNDFLTFVWSSWECFGVTWDSLVAHRRSVLRGYFLKKTLNKFQKKVGFWKFCSGRGWLSEACRSILPR